MRRFGLVIGVRRGKNTEIYKIGFIGEGRVEAKSESNPRVQMSGKTKYYYKQDRGRPGPTTTDIPDAHTPSGTTRGAPPIPGPSPLPVAHRRTLGHMAHGSGGAPAAVLTPPANEGGGTPETPPPPHTVH